MGITSLVGLNIQLGTVGRLGTRLVRSSGRGLTFKRCSDTIQGVTSPLHVFLVFGVSLFFTNYFLNTILHFDRSVKTSLTII